MFTLHLRLFARVFLYVGCFLLLTLFACKEDEPSGDNTTPEPQAKKKDSGDQKKKDDEQPKDDAPSSTTPPANPSSTTPPANPSSSTPPANPSFPTPPANLSKREVALFYYKAYLAAKTDVNWTGSVSPCKPGDISEGSRKQTLARINYFRKQAGYTKKLTQGSAEGHKKAQSSALMMRANKSLSHNPPEGWKCYTKGGADASRGNLHYGSADVASASVTSVTAFMEDAGDHNKRVGHRAWFLFPGIDQIAVGATDNTATIWWETEHTSITDFPAGTPEFVAWPPEGYVIDDLVFDRWSLHLNNFKTNASDASVRMVELHTGRVLKPSIVHRYIPYTRQNVSPFNTLVWEPEGIKMPSGTEDTEDITYKVTISNLRVNGQTKEYIYEVIIIDPGTTETP